MDFASHPDCRHNLSRAELIRFVIGRKEALPTATGALATWYPPSSTGRSPKDTSIVRRSESGSAIDWTSPNNNAMTPVVFNALYEQVLQALAASPQLYQLDRVVGARSSYALPVRVVTNRALTALFADTMFRPIPKDIRSSKFADQSFTILVAPASSVDLGQCPVRSPIAIAMDMDRRICIIMGTLYLGTLKKMVFTVMNYLLPPQGILPLHSSAVETSSGACVLFLGLSGTGKTTLSSDPSFLFIGDDEHGWSSEGIVNFEYGCYAKLVRLDPERERAISHAAFDPRPVEENGCIIENALMWPDGTFDLCDERLTENSRTAYPISFLPNVKTDAAGGHPSAIIFLTADANGVLPPIAKLTPTQSILWFLMGYTSKLAGTEVGVKEPSTTFSRFFGQPFMPRLPNDYTRLFEEYTTRHHTPVYLINTGWSGGPYGQGKRMDINLTRQLVNAAIDGTLQEAEFDEDPLFHIMVPRACPGVSESSVLHPRQTWEDPAGYDARAKKLAQEFSDYFDKNFASLGLSAEIVRQCPWK